MYQGCRYEFMLGLGDGTVHQDTKIHPHLFCGVKIMIISYLCR